MRLPIRQLSFLIKPAKFSSRKSVTATVTAQPRKESWLKYTNGLDKENRLSETPYTVPIEIRPAVSEDAEGIAHAFIESAVFHAELDPERYATPAIETISARYREGLQHPSHAGGEEMTLVAEFGGEIVGFIDARLEQSPDLMHREIIYCHIAEIAVSGRHQSRGIGSHLLQAAEEWGRKMGAEFASLEFHTENKRAGLFYQKRMGYRPASITVIKRLCQ